MKKGKKEERRFYTKVEIMWYRKIGNRVTYRILKVVLARLMVFDRL